MVRFTRFETILTAITRFVYLSSYVLASILWMAALVGVWPTVWAGDFDEAERLYTDHCAVCHGADRGGYIGPALNSEETKLTEEQISTKIVVGAAKTLMPQHPTWLGALSSKEMSLLASLVAHQPR